MPLTWDDALEKKLLLNIIDLAGTTSIPWSQLAARMGPEATEVACKRKFQKLKEAVKAEYGVSGSGGAAEGDGEAAAASPKTPAKGKGGRKKGEGESAKKSTGKRKMADAAGGGEDVASPTKKVKVEVEDDDAVL